MDDPLTPLLDLEVSMKSTIADIGRNFTEPEDDWDPIFIMVNAEDEHTLMALPLNLFGTGSEKDMLVRILQSALQQYGAVRYGLLLNAHMKSWENNEDGREAVEAVRNETVRIKDIEGSREVLVLTVADAETERTFICNIVRDGERPPTLTEWEAMDGSAEGRFMGLNEAIRRINT